MSLCVLTFVFAGFCSKINSWNSSTFLFSLWRARGRPKTIWRRTVEKERDKAGWKSWNVAKAAARKKEYWAESVTALCAYWRQEKWWWWCFHSRWHTRFSRFPIPSIQRPQKIFNCHGKDFSGDKLRNRILLSRLQRNFSCGTKRVIPSGQDRSILPARVANQSTGFGSSWPLTKIPI